VIDTASFKINNLILEVAPEGSNHYRVDNILAIEHRTHRTN